MGKRYGERYRFLARYLSNKNLNKHCRKRYLARLYKAFISVHVLVNFYGKPLCDLHPVLQKINDR
jgi:hypothetical protein